MTKFSKQFLAHLMGETWDTIPGNRDPRPGTQLLGETWNLRLKTLKVGPKTRDLGPLL